jgi:hypothetical protein
MDWTITLCLAAALIFAGLLLLLFREIFKEIAPAVESLDQSCLTESDDDVRTATLMLRHSFVVTMMDQYRDIGSQRDIIDFINEELCSRNASWRVRSRPDGSGEFYDLKRTNKLSAAIFSREPRERRRG